MSFCKNLFQCLVKLFCLFHLGILKIIIFPPQFVFFFAHFRDDVVWRSRDLLRMKGDLYPRLSLFLFSPFPIYFSSFSFFWNLFVLVFNKLATRSKADSSSVYPIERKFAWRAANSLFKLSSNFLHSHKISHVFAGKSSCRHRLQMVQPYVLAKVGPGVLRALKRASGPNHLRSRC